MVSPASGAFSLVCAVACFAACTSLPPGPPLAAQPTGALIEVDYPPPPARVEFLPKQPSDDSVWVGGEWLWQGRKWAWKPGMWVVPPSNAAYARRALVRREDGKLFFAPGSWRDPRGNEVPAPPEKVAPTRSATVVTPEGEPAQTAPDIHLDAGAMEAGAAD